MPSKPRRQPARAKRPVRSVRSKRAATARVAVMRRLAPITRLCASLRGTPVRRRAAAPHAAPATKAVTFTCDNAALVLVTISTQAGALLLQPSGTFNLLPGDQKILWSAKGTSGAAFRVSVSGGSLDDPIQGPLPSGGNGGIRILTVS